MPRTLGILLGVFYLYVNLKFKNMMLIICMLIGFCFFLLEQVWELKKQVTDIEKIVKSMNDDLNMVSKTMDNMYRNQQGAKQILKG